MSSLRATLSRLPHVHGGRGRRRLRVPPLRTDVRGRARSCSARLGIGRRGDGRRREAGGSLSGGRRRRGRDTSRHRATRSRHALGKARRLGGCCCAHVGAARGLADRVDRLGIVWIDAHGDLNTPETSPSGNLWGMPLRMLLDDGVVRHADVALVGARNLDPPEVRVHGRDGNRRFARARARGRRRRVRRARPRRPRPCRGRRLHGRAGRPSDRRGRSDPARDVAARAKVAGHGGHGAFARASATSPWSRGSWALQASESQPL